MDKTQLRAERNTRLAATDFWMTVDVFPKLNEAYQEDLIDYRQALRDITNGFADDATDIDPTWPTAPTPELTK